MTTVEREPGEGSSLEYSAALVALDGFPLAVTLKENLGIAYLTQALRNNGIPVHLLDAAEMELGEQDVLRRIIELKPTLVGFSTVFSNVSASLDIATKVRLHLPRTAIVCGGHQMLRVADSVLDNEPQVDAVFIGEAEQSLLSVMLLLAEEPRKDLLNSQVPGVVHRASVKPFRVAAATDQMLNLAPARDVARFRSYRGKFPISFVSASRGCYAACSFCSDPVFNQMSASARWRPRSIESVVDEIGDLVRIHGVRYIIFCDDDFVGLASRHGERLDEFCQLIRSRNIHINFRFSTRAINVLTISGESLQNLRSIGLDRVYVGIESGSPADLRTFKKGVTVEQNQNVFERLDSFGIPLQIGFIMFHPYSTFSTLYENGLFLSRVGQSALFKNFSQAFEAFPGTALADQVGEDGLYLRPDLVYRDCSYKFIDTDVQELFDLLHRMEPDMSPLDQLMFKVMYSVPKVSQDLRVERIVRELRDLQLEVGLHNAAFFVTALRSCAAERESEALNFVERSYNFVSRGQFLLSELERKSSIYAHYRECVKE